MSRTDPKDMVTEPEHLREEIEQTREDLAHTIDALSSRLDFKARAVSNAHAAKQAVLDSVAKTKGSLPPSAARTMDQTGVVVHRALAWARPRHTQLLLGSLAVAALVVGLRQVGERR